MTPDFKNQKLLIVSPHPDDEVLGCGGLIKRVKDQGGEVHILFLTVGDTQEYSKKGVSNGNERISEIERVSKFLKYDDYQILFEGNTFHLRLDTVPQIDLVSKIEESLNRIKPTIVAMPRHQDYNQDHRAAAQALISATRPAPSDFKPFQKIVLAYESVPVANWAYNQTENPNFYVSLSKEELKAKLKALSIYKSQVRKGAHARSLRSMENLAKFRGMQIGQEYAEAYICYRNVI
jgi:LmbE family N-acetylglucosaminyl deacetylase